MQDDHQIRESNKRGPQETKDSVRQCDEYYVFQREERQDPLRTCRRCDGLIDIDYYLTWEGQDYCNEGCLSKSDWFINPRCAECHRPVSDNLLGRFCVRFGTSLLQFCRADCLNAYKHERKFCTFCFQELANDDAAGFCSKICRDAVRSSWTRQISAECFVCGKWKRVELTAHTGEETKSLCSERCLVAYNFVSELHLVKCVVCAKAFVRKPGDYSIYNRLEWCFSVCSEECRKIHMIRHQTLESCFACGARKYHFDMICCVEVNAVTCACCMGCLTACLESSYMQLAKCMARSVGGAMPKETEQMIREKRNTHVQTISIAKPVNALWCKNKATLCRPIVAEEPTQTGHEGDNVATQTDDPHYLLPIPTPLFVPIPLAMYVQPVPMMTPIPVPLLVPVFIPTGYRSVDEMSGEVEKILSGTWRPDVLQEDVRIATDATKKVTLESAFTEKPAVAAEKNTVEYIYGLVAWIQWVRAKNRNLRDDNTPTLIHRKLSDINAEELCFYLVHFIKDVRKLDGTTYAPDTVYYFCLGIQVYFNCIGRKDNIFLDSKYARFAHALNDIALAFCGAYDTLNECKYLTTRVEEEHMWASKQLGAHSPMVLVQTLLYFNTKYFKRFTVDDHAQLKVTDVVKRWRKGEDGIGRRRMVLKFLHGNRNADAYQVLENAVDFDRCPVRLYELYVGKLPSKVNRSDYGFYLIPERNSIIDSPIWFTDRGLGRRNIEMMLNRFKMIKEIAMILLDL